MPSPLTGQATCTGVSSAVALSSTPVQCSVFVIRAPSTNSAAVYLGASNVTSTTGYSLEAGAELVYERNTYQTDARRELSVSDFYVAGNSGDTVTWLASP